MNKLLTRPLLIALCVSLAACASSPQQRAGDKVVKTEAQYYKDASEALKAGNYTNAVNSLEALESQYPVGTYTEQAQIELIYGKYMQGEFAGSLAAADRYLRLHPESNRLDYVLYLHGLANYSLDQDSLLRRLPVNMAYRDPGHTRAAFEDFRQLVTRYPASPYAADARQRMVHIRNQLAEAEMHVARYYETRGAHVSVINRARWVVENYPESAAIPEALRMLVRNYRAMGMGELAAQTEALLKTASMPAPASTPAPAPTTAPVPPVAG